MANRLGRLDPFGHLSAPCLVHAWLAVLIVLHCFSVLGALGMGRWIELAYFAAMLGGLIVAALASHPAAKVGLLSLWVAWWTFRFARWPGLHPGIVVMMLISVYVVARVVWAWRRDGVAAVRVGARHPLVHSAGWPELAGLTKRERRLVLARARAMLPRQRVFSRRLVFGSAVFLAIMFLELAFFPPHDTDSTLRTVELPRSQLGFLAIVPLLVMRDPRDEEEPLRRALRDPVLPQFWREPWNWDRARREAAAHMA